MKTRSSKTPNIDIIPMGLSLGFGPKWPFFQLFFLGNVGQENVFYEILERKNAFLGHKNICSKTREIDFFPKGLTHGFGPKMTIFTPFFFRQ